MKTKLIIGLISTIFIIITYSTFVPNFTGCFIVSFYGVFALGYFAAKDYKK